MMLSRSEASSPGLPGCFPAVQYDRFLTLHKPLRTGMIKFPSCMLVLLYGIGSGRYFAGRLWSVVNKKGFPCLIVC